MPQRTPYTRIQTAKTYSLLLAAFVATLSCAQAGPEDTASSKDVNKNVIEKPVTEPKFYVEIGAAGEFDFHATKFISNGNADFGVVGAYALPARIQSRDFTSAHDAAAVDGRVNFGYIVNPLISVYGGFVYTHDDGDHSRRLGTVIDQNGAFGVAGGKYDLYGDLGQYQSYAGITGVKFTLPRTILDFIHAPKFISPYFNASVGAKYIDDQHIRFYSGTVPAVNTTLDLYNGSFVFTTMGGFGYELKLARNFSINIDTDYGYDTAPERGDRVIDGTPNNTGFRGINNNGDRFYETVGMTAVFKF
jgi:hypothetical protein